MFNIFCFFRHSPLLEHVLSSSITVFMPHVKPYNTIKWWKLNLKFFFCWCVSLSTGKRPNIDLKLEKVTLRIDIPSKPYPMQTANLTSGLKCQFESSYLKENNLTMDRKWSTSSIFMWFNKWISKSFWDLERTFNKWIENGSSNSDNWGVAVIRK